MHSHSSDDRWSGVLRTIASAIPALSGGRAVWCDDPGAGTPATPKADRKLADAATAAVAQTFTSLGDRGRQPHAPSAGARR